MDRAQAREEEMRQDALDERSRRSPAADGESAAECTECGQAIPAERRKALPGVKTCVECQRDLERTQGWGLF